MARELNRLPVRYFAMISNRSTLGEYNADIDGNAHKFYNKCAQYLLESICTYLKPHLNSDEDIDVRFEEMNHDYDKMRRFLGRIKENPIYPQSRSLSFLNPFGISTLKKGESEMLEVADFVAHAVYQCANRIEANFGIPEPRYFSKMSSRFAGCDKGLPDGIGLKFIHDLASMQLEPEIEALFSNFRVVPPKKVK